MEGGLLETLASVCCCKKKQSQSPSVIKQKPSNQEVLPKRTRLQDAEEKDSTFNDRNTEASKPDIRETADQTITIERVNTELTPDQKQQARATTPTETNPDQSQEQAPTDTPAPVQEKPADEWLSVLEEVIKSSKIDEILATVQETVTTMSPDSNFTLISDAKSDPITLYFQVGDHEELKDKFHKFISSYKAPYDPKYFVLRNCLLSSEERTKSNSNIARYYTPIRGKIGDTYYMLNQVQFKKVLAMTPKESVCIKALKVLPSGDVIEHNVSFEHPRFPNDPALFERFIVIANPIYYRKTDSGLEAKSFNFVVPRSKMPMLMLKGVMNKSYNGTFLAISEILKSKVDSPEEMDLMEKAFAA